MTANDRREIMDFLKVTQRRCEELADRIDPERKNKSHVARQLTGMLMKASGLWFYLNVEEKRPT